MPKKKYPEAIHLWVIASKTKKPGGIWHGEMRRYFFAKRTSIKNRHYTTDFHWQIKFFSTKHDAEQFYFKKSRYGFDVSPYRVTRRKVKLSKEGYLDYWDARELVYR